MSLKSKMQKIRQQMENPTAPRDIVEQFGQFFEVCLLIKSFKYIMRVPNVQYHYRVLSALQICV